MTKKNLIILMIDGGRLDRAINSTIFNNLKSKSIFLSQSITYGPHTIAAMHSTFSGSYGTRTGTNSYWSTFKFKKDRFKTLTEYLKEYQYYTHADVINELVIPKQGFDKFIVHDEINDNLTERHKEIIQTTSAQCQEKPFFLYLHYSKIHTGIMNQVLKKFTNFSAEFFENKELNEKRYDKLFFDAEKYLEEILQQIYDLHLDENSLILIMSDHGVSTGEKFGERAYGAFCYDYTLKTFTYFLSSDLQPKEIQNQVRLIDFMPTILEYMGIPLDPNYEQLDGISLLPAFQGKQIPEIIAYSETGNPLKNKVPPKEPNTKSVRTSKWKLIYNEYDVSKELYNLKDDPDEENNLINSGLEIERFLWEELKKYKNPS
jgi:arylsulfatase A-like enzyme